MRREVLPGASYGFALPDGGWGALYPDSHIDTSEGRVEVPGENVLFLVGARHRGRVVLAGQGHQSGACWFWDGLAWQEVSGTFGVSPCAFGSGLLCVAIRGDRYLQLALATGVVTELPLSIGSQGFRYVDEGGTPVTGDATYRAGALFEYTQRGDVRVGQGQDGGAILNGRVLEPGDCRFIRFERAWEQLAIAIVQMPERRCVLHWLTVAEIAALPGASIVPPPSVPPVLPPVPPLHNPPPTEIPMSEIADQSAVVASVRSGYPTPLGMAHAACLLDICRAIGMGAGLLRKDSGTNIQLPDGTRVSQDIICFPSGRIFDCLGDAEGQARPGWSEAEGGPFPDRYYRVGATVPPVTPPAPVTPPWTPPPTPPSDALARLEMKIDRLLSVFRV